MDTSEQEMEAEYEVLNQLAERRWVLNKELRAIDEIIGKNSNYWQVSDDGLVALK